MTTTYKRLADQMAQAACAGDTSRVWISAPAERQPADIHAAQTICTTCPVIAHCYTQAANDPHFEGIAGGIIWRTAHAARLSPTTTRATR